MAGGQALPGRGDQLGFSRRVRQALQVVEPRDKFGTALGGEPLGLDRFGDLASLELVVVGFGEDGVQVVDDDDGGNLDGEKKDRCQNKGSADFTADFHGGEITANRGISKTGNPPPEKSHSV